MPLSDVEGDRCPAADLAARDVTRPEPRSRSPASGGHGRVPRFVHVYTWVLLGGAAASMLGLVVALALASLGASQGATFVCCTPLLLVGYPVLLAAAAAALVDPSGSAPSWTVAFWTVLGVFCAAHLVASWHLWRRGPMEGSMERGAALFVLTMVYPIVGEWITFATYG